MNDVVFVDAILCEKFCTFPLGYVVILQVDKTLEKKQASKDDILDDRAFRGGNKR